MNNDKIVSKYGIIKKQSLDNSSNISNPVINKFGFNKTKLVQYNQQVEININILNRNGNKVYNNLNVSPKNLIPIVEPVPPPIPILGRNSTYVGFGGSTGSVTNEHWLHDFTWLSNYQTFNFTDLKNNSNLLNNATIVNNSIRFTTANSGQTGNVFLKDLIGISDTDGNVINWSCYYVFSMGGGGRADGMSFILQSTSNAAGGVGGGLAYDGIQKSIAVGYDSFSNANDISNNHIELDVNGDVSNSLIQYQPPFDLCGTSGTDKYIYNWVDYIDGILKIYCSITNTKPLLPFIEYVININDYLEIPIPSSTFVFPPWDGIELFGASNIGNFRYPPWINTELFGAILLNTFTYPPMDSVELFYSNFISSQQYPPWNDWILTNTTIISSQVYPPWNDWILNT
jgi:hypothetical protein